MAAVALSFSKKWNKATQKLDRSLKLATLNFIGKLQDDPTSPGLHIERIENSIDPRIRSGRVNQQYRAILFELTGKLGTHYLVEGIYNHDDAYAQARKLRLEINPVNGVTNVLEEAAAAEAAGEVPFREPATEHAGYGAGEPAAEQASAQGSNPATRIEHDAAATPLITADRDELLNVLGLPEAIADKALAITNEQELAVLGQHQPSWIADALVGLASGLSVAEVHKELGFADDPADETDVASADAATDAATEGTAAEEKKDERPAASTSQKKEEAGDEELIAGLKTKAARMDYLYIGDGDEAGKEALQQVIESGDFNQWRVFLHPTQRAIVERNFSGAGRVLGGAGTGKTVVAVHRADRLAREGAKDGARVLLTTFTATLAADLRQQIDILNEHRTGVHISEKLGEPGLYIKGVDAAAGAVVRQASAATMAESGRRVLGMPVENNPQIMLDADKEWESVGRAAGDDLSPEKRSAEFLRNEFEAVVLGNGINKETEYKRVPRRGRGTPLSRKERGAVWKIFQDFIRQCTRVGRYPFSVITALAAEVVSIDFPDGLFDHVVIDEAQDFHAGHWRFIRAAVPVGRNDIFLAEDSHQRIYGQRLVLSHFGIHTRGRASTRLTLNYRTTQENLHMAVAILEALDPAASEQEWIDSAGEVDSIVGYRSARSGPRPVVKAFDRESDEVEFLATEILGWINDAEQEGAAIHVGVLLRRNDWVNRYSEELGARGVPIAVRRRNGDAGGRSVADDSESVKVDAMTMHSAKGMEFTHVVLPALSEALMPQTFGFTDMAEAARADAMQRERALLYVAASRARDVLVMTWSGQKSPMLP